LISPKPNPDAWRVLALVVANPGQLDAEAIGQRLWRPALTSTADYLRVRASILASSPEWSERASVVLAALTRQGLIARRRGPMLSEEIRGPDPCVDMVLWAADVLAASDHAFAEDSGRAINLLVYLVMFGPPSVGMWAGSSPNGATKRAVSALYEAGIVVPPSFRWATSAGVALIEGES
jgi:hypothetical protein